MAAATTTMMIATSAFGSQAITAVSRSEIGFGPKTPKASCRVNRMIA
jgi:hypothetical protein